VLAADPTDPEPPPVTFAVQLTSTPVGAQVFIDGAPKGAAAPGRGIPLPAGRHDVRMALGDATISRTVTVSSMRANRFHWDVSAGTLSSTQ
jgi:hypothetical protein